MKTCEISSLYASWAQPWILRYMSKDRKIFGLQKVQRLHLPHLSMVLSLLMRMRRFVTVHLSEAMPL